MSGVLLKRSHWLGELLVPIVLPEDPVFHYFSHICCTHSMNVLIIAFALSEFVRLEDVIL